MSKYIVRSCGPPSQTWRTFLENHARRLVSIDFFTVPTLRFQFLRLVEEERRTRGNMIRILLEDALKEKEHKE